MLGAEAASWGERPWASLPAEGAEKNDRGERPAGWGH